MRCASLCNDFANILRRRKGAFAVKARQHYHKFFAAIAGHKFLAVARNQLKYPGEASQTIVACLMPVSVIKVFEPVHIQQNDGKGLCAVAGLLPGRPVESVEFSSVRQARQSVKITENFKFFVGLCQFCGALGNALFQAGPFVKKGYAHVVECLGKFGQFPVFGQFDALAKALGGVGGNMLCNITGSLQGGEDKRVEQVAGNNQDHT